MHEALSSVSSEFISAKIPAVCRFMDKYVTGLYGSRSIINWIAKNKGKHFLHMVTMSDIAYTVAVIENSYEAWDEEHKLNAGEGHEKTVKTKFTNRVGKKRQCNMSGWSADGIQFYNKVRDSWRALSLDQSNPTWSMLEEEWAAYEDKTNLCRSSRRKKNEHEEPEDDYYDGGDHCPDLWDKFVLLDGDEDFMDERPSWNKRTREDPLSSYEDDDESDSSSLLEEDDGEHLGQLPRVSLNGTDMIPV